MAKPDLYRSGNTSNGRWDNARVNQEYVLDKDGYVVLNNGKGISSFTSKGADWPANKTWILKAATALPSGLKAVNDHGNHYIIAPNEKMKLDGYISRLAKINTLNVPYTPPPQHVEFVVPKQSNHSSKSVLFLVNALLTVYHQKLGASDWDDNDYACIASIATSLESGELSLDELSCKEGAQDTKSQYMAAQAVGLYIGTDLKKAATLGEDETDANDHAVLYSALGLHSSTGHPLIDVLKTAQNSV